MSFFGCIITTILRLRRRQNYRHHPKILPQKIHRRRKNHLRYRPNHGLSHCWKATTTAKTFPNLVRKQ